MVTKIFIVAVDDNDRELEPATPWTARICAPDGTLLAVGFGTNQTDAMQNALQDPLSSWTPKPASPTFSPPAAQAARGTETRAGPACSAQDDELHGPTSMP